MSAKTVRIGRCILGERKPPKRSDKPFSRALARIREVEKVIRARHGQIVPDPSDTDDWETCLNYIRAAAFSLAPQGMEDWCRRWAPWIRPSDLILIENEVRNRKRMISADGAAGLLRITLAERTHLDLRTIGSCDVVRIDRIGLAKDRKRERDRQRQAANRRAAGRQDRASYESQSLSRTKPWEAEGKSRAAWYRARETSPSRIVDTSTGDTPVSPQPFRSQDARGEAGRAGVWGPRSQRRDREAEPLGSCDEPAGEAA